ncbi:hypothetical protein SRS16CHR_01016 [Variovorax sp. SRS16]|uniref:hypothetical protein n=1 Tax=Variovorax sp. SRS16 TaxID=282217 RepID=UPI001315FF36|nr:hypothetical protein [Variovorax sp. SRS16]VTU14285.1 hypothetical protein SRS16CHR_01016 [Variovorax sp. SRS16]
MKTRLVLGAHAAAAMILTCIPASGQSMQQADSPIASEQLESDYRVIAARCGTPAFEKAFTRRSKAAVAAGLVVKGRDPVAVEKNITALRRNPIVLVSASADCPARLAQLNELLKSRNGLIKAAHGRGADRASR